MSKTIEQREQIIDNKTGELLSDKTNIVDMHQMQPEPAYIKLYIDDLSGLRGLTAGETQILLYVAACSNYQGEVLLPTGIKQRIAKTIKCSEGAVNNAVNEFCKKQILKKDGGGLYLLNPDLFARGKWREIRERRKTFQAVMTYYPNGEKTIETRIID